jgi:hypothetical protein
LDKNTAEEENLKLIKKLEEKMTWLQQTYEQGSQKQA